jgi:BMFP domain-containing protein YqiC
MTGSPDDVQFQILEHLRALREEVARLHERIGALENRLADDQRLFVLREKA